MKMRIDEKQYANYENQYEIVISTSIDFSKDEYKKITKAIEMLDEVMHERLIKVEYAERMIKEQEAANKTETK